VIIESVNHSGACMPAWIADLHSCSNVEMQAEGARYQLMMCRNLSIVDAHFAAPKQKLILQTQANHSR
jgi:hypothetical protein